MSKPMNRGLLSLGAVLIILVVVILLYVSSIIPLWATPPLFIVLCGIWIFALAEIQATNPEKYARSAYGLAIWGVLMIAVGGAWFTIYYNIIYSVVILLVACAAVLIFTAMRRK
jgi:hypothetical protein